MQWLPQGKVTAHMSISSFNYFYLYFCYWFYVVYRDITHGHNALGFYWVYVISVLDTNGEIDTGSYQLSGVFYLYPIMLIYDG